MDLIRSLLAAGMRAHPGRRDLEERAGDFGPLTGVGRRARRRWAWAAVAVTALAAPLLAGATPALASAASAALAGAAAANTNTAHVYWGNGDATNGFPGAVGRATVDATKVN